MDDVRRLSKVPPFAWSSYRLDRRDDALEFRQVVGAAAGQAVGDVGWTADEAVRFRVHVPSEIPFHNSRSGVRARQHPGVGAAAGRARLKGSRWRWSSRWSRESILYSTLLLFGGTIVAAALAFAVAIWLIVRKGRAGRRHRIGPDCSRRLPTTTDGPPLTASRALPALPAVVFSSFFTSNARNWLAIESRDHAGRRCCSPRLPASRGRAPR